MTLNPQDIQTKHTVIVGWVFTCKMWEGFLTPILPKPDSDHPLLKYLQTPLIFLIGHSTENMVH